MYTGTGTLYSVNVDQPLPQDPVYKRTQCDTCTLQKSCEVHVTICTNLLWLSLNSLELAIIINQPLISHLGINPLAIRESQ